MRAPEDLHPDDRHVRINLRDMLIQRRIDLGLTQTDLGRRIGASKQGVGFIERNETWRLVNIQRIARGLGWRLALEPEGLPTDPLAGIGGFRPAGPDRADRWDQQALIAALIYARTALGLSQAAVGERLGIGMRSVSAFENAEALMFITPQRYCRALGGVLSVGVEDAAELVAA